MYNIDYFQNLLNDIIFRQVSRTYYNEILGLGDDLHLRVSITGNQICFNCNVI